MKFIKISTDMELSVHDFPDGDHCEQNRVLKLPAQVYVDDRAYKYTGQTPQEFFKDFAVE